MTRLRAAAALLLALALAGCDERGACVGYECVPHGPLKLRYAVEMNPPAGSGLVREQLTDLTTDADGSAALTMSAPAVLSGRVFVGGPAAPSVWAHISAEMSGDPIIPGRLLVFETDSTAAVNAGAASFNLPVAPGSYNLHVTTPDPRIPPIVVPVTVMGDRTLDITLPGWNDLLAVGGWIYDGFASGVADLRVHVVDSHGRVLSTTATTGPDGAFLVGMPRGPGMYVLRAEPRDAQTLLPALEQPLVVGTGNVAPIILRMPAYQPAQLYSFHAIARSASGNLTAVTGVRFSFSVQLFDPDSGGVRATFTTTAQTDAQGTAQVKLIPAPDYTVTVQTSPDSDFASQVLLHFMPDLNDVAVPLGPKTPIIGTLYGDDGKTIANAVVQAVGMTASAVNGIAPNAAPTNAAVGLTDQGGRFRLLVDPGRYDLEAAPPDGSSYPHWAVEDVYVATSEVPVDIHLPPANRVSGRITGPEGYPLASVDVRVYLITQAGYGRLRGQAQSAANGSFTLVLASPRQR